MNSQVKLHQSWLEPLAAEFDSPYMHALRSFLLAAKAEGKRIFPKGSEYFRALDLTPLDAVRIVILGQDPYHGPGQAHGLCFSVQNGVRTPPSLVNIYKELQSDLGIPPARHGHLEHWARQGVLLLNPTLTIEVGRIGSHLNCGWQVLTAEIVKILCERDDPPVFMLWGGKAEAFFAAARPAGRAPRVLTTRHPSNDFGRKFMAEGRHFLATADRVDWWAL